MRTFAIGVIFLMCSSHSFATSESCGCTMPLTIQMAQYEAGFSKLVLLTESEASQMLSESVYLDQENLDDASQKFSLPEKIDFFMLETVAKSSKLKQEVLIVSERNNCQVIGRYKTYEK